MDIIKEIEGMFVNIEQLPYYSSLLKNEFTNQDTMRAQLQDLGRAVGCMGLRNIQIAKLKEEHANGCIQPNDFKRLHEAIIDEDEQNERPSYFDIRLQIFTDKYPKDVLLSVDPLPEVKEANKRFKALFTDRSLVEITAAVGSIEKWYVPVAAMLEKAYLMLGYTPRQVETYTLHKIADVEHSEIALDFVIKYANSREKKDAVLNVVKEGFATTYLYDLARQKAAKDKSRTFESYLWLLR